MPITLGILATGRIKLSVDFLVLAGGGGSNTIPEQSGGGGAGGLRSSVAPTGGGASAESILTLETGTLYTVQVGGGGALGSNGTDSILASITSLGGGYGGLRANGNSGGSGGGGGDYVTPSGGAGTSGQGYAGGSSGVFGSDAAAGGGGAGGLGGNTTNSGQTAGVRGIPVNNSISGVSVAYGEGGLGGGQTGLNGSASPANIGKGGDSGESFSYAGGSGLIIVKYPDSRSINVGGGLTATTSSSGGFKITTFTAGLGQISFS